MRVKIIKCETHAMTDERGNYLKERRTGMNYDTVIYKDGSEELQEKVNEFIQEVIEHDLLKVISIQYQVASGGGDNEPFVEYTAMITYE